MSNPQEEKWIADGDRISYSEDVVLIYVASMADAALVKHVVALHNGHATKMDADSCERWESIHGDHIGGAESGFIMGVTERGEDADYIAELHNKWLEFVPEPGI